jgi:hypothetical protein
MAAGPFFSSTRFALAARLSFLLAACGRDVGLRDQVRKPRSSRLAIALLGVGVRRKLD